jgi:hypothetical protein
LLLIPIAWRKLQSRIPDPIQIQTVEPFVLADREGNTHRLSDWRDDRAIVIVVDGDPSLSDRFGRSLATLHDRFRPKSVRFFAVNPDPRSTEFASNRPFPTLLDPAQLLTGDLGVTAFPSAAVLDGQGHVLYRGPIQGLETAIAAATEGRATSADPAWSDPATRPMPTPAPILASERRVTYHRDVAPILWRRCASCHRPGEVGPFSLLSYKDAAKRARFLADIAQSREMPPWRAVYGYGDFHDDGRLTREEIAVLDRWAETGTAEGDPSDRSQPPAFFDGWQLGKPDLVLTAPQVYTLPGDATDVYRFFVVPAAFTQDLAVAAVEFRPGNRKIVHHARFFSDTTGRAVKADAGSPEPGFPFEEGIGLIQQGVQGLGGWVPGLIPRMPPTDVGRLVRKGSDLVMLIHYHGSGKVETDQSSLGLYLCKTPPKRSVMTLSLVNTEIDIPPGEPRHRIAMSHTTRADCYGLSVLPHGHQLMSEISLTAILPDGRIVPLLWIDRWDFNWQGQYYFARQMFLPKGTRLDVVAYFDNSSGNPRNPFSPPRRVKFGLRSTDEMLGCHLSVIAADADAQRIFDETEAPSL